MSLSAQHKYALLKELPAGIHLVMISEVSLVKDENGQVVRSEDKGVRVKVQFIAMNPEIKRFEQRFWAKSSLMLKMCEAFKIDALAQRFDLEALNKRGYVAIKEVRTYLNPEEQAINVDYFIFDFFAWEESLKVPKIIGDPQNGPIGGKFLEYKDSKHPIHNIGANIEIKDGEIHANITYKEDDNMEFSLKPNLSLMERLIPLQDKENLEALRETQQMIKKKELSETFLFNSRNNTGERIIAIIEEHEPFQSLSQKLKPKPKKDGPINWTDL